MTEIIKTNSCIINYSENLKELANETIKILDKKIPEYEKIFNINLKEKVIVNYFDDKESFRKFIYEIRGEDTLPEYATATYDEGMINAYIKKENQLERIYTSSHELFHIFYMMYILKDDYSKRIVWYDEGMAQFMSGEKDKYNDLIKFKEYYNKVKKNTIEIPKLNELTHGKSFVNENYNAYDLSYLSIKYLNETLKKEEFKNLISDFSRIKLIGEKVIEEMFNYYDNLFYN